MGQGEVLTDCTTVTQLGLTTSTPEGRAPSSALALARVTLLRDLRWAVQVLSTILVSTY